MAPLREFLGLRLKPNLNLCIKEDNTMLCLVKPATHLAILYGDRSEFFFLASFPVAVPAVLWRRCLLSERLQQAG